MPDSISKTLQRKWINVLVYILLAGMLSVGIGALAASFISFQSLQAKIKSISATGQIVFFTPDFYDAMQMRLRAMGAAYIIAAILFFALRERIYRFFARVFADSRELGAWIRSSIRSISRTDRFALSGLTIFAAFLRIPLLFQPMRWGEAFIFLQYSSHPFYAAISFYDAPGNHLFNTLLVRVAYLIFGNHPWALRLPAFLAGMAMIPATYAASRSLYRGGAPLLAAALVTSSLTLIDFSTLVWGYTILGLLFLLLITLGSYALRHDNWGAWFFVAVLTGLGFYTIPIMLYAAGAVMVWMLLSAAVGDAQPDRRSLVKGLILAFTLTAVITVVLYTPVLAVSGPKAVVANRFVTPIGLHAFLHDLPPSLATTWRDWNQDWPLYLTILLVAGFGLSLLLHRRLSRFKIPLPVALVIWIVPLLLVQRVVPFVRVWLFVVPLYLMASAAGLAVALKPFQQRLHSRYLGALAALAIAIFLGLHVRNRNSIYLSNYGRGLEQTALYLKGQLHPGDSVIARDWSEQSLRYYLLTAGVPLTYVNASNPQRTFAVVNDITADKLPDVLASANMSSNTESQARFLVKYDSASLYEIRSKAVPSDP